MSYLFLALAFICNAGANFLLKLAALRGFSFASFFSGIMNVSTVYAASAVALFGLNLAFYLIALERIPLSVGYPIMIGMTFFMTIIASVVLGEKINLFQAVGMTFIIAGILLVATAAHR